MTKLTETEMQPTAAPITEPETEAQKPEEEIKLTTAQKWAVTILIMVGLGWIIDRPSYTIENGTATIAVKLSSYDDLESAAHEVLEDIYRVAHKQPRLTEILVNVTMSGSGLTDRYGNRSDNLTMGSIRWDRFQIEEAQRFKKADRFKFDDSNKLIVMTQLRMMSHSYLLD